MASTQTLLKVVNQSLTALGDKRLTAFPETTPTSERSTKAKEHYESVIDATLASHPWNFAMKRAILQSYVTPVATLTPGATSGTGITFIDSTSGVFFTLGVSDVGKLLIHSAGTGRATITAHVSTTPAATLTPAALSGTGINLTASAAVFAAGDVGKVVTTTGGAVATITAFTSTTIVVATINTAFAALTAVASGSWTLTATDRVVATITATFQSVAAIASQLWFLENVPPVWGYTHSLTVPTDCLRLWRVGDDEHEPRDRYQRELGYFVSDVSVLRCRYISQVVDPALWSPLFVRAFVYHLAAVLADATTGKQDRVASYFKLYEGYMKQARTIDGMEGSAEMLFIPDLVNVRRRSSGTMGPTIQ